MSLTSSPSRAQDDPHRGGEDEAPSRSSAQQLSHLEGVRGSAPGDIVVFFDNNWSQRIVTVEGLRQREEASQHQAMNSGEHTSGGGRHSPGEVSNASFELSTSTSAQQQRSRGFRHLQHLLASSVEAAATAKTQYDQQHRSKMMAHHQPSRLGSGGGSTNVRSPVGSIAGFPPTAAVRKGRTSHNDNEQPMDCPSPQPLLLARSATPALSISSQQGVFGDSSIAHSPTADATPQPRRGESNFVTQLRQYASKSKKAVASGIPPRASTPVPNTISSSLAANTALNQSSCSGTSTSGGGYKWGGDVVQSVALGSTGPVGTSTGLPEGATTYGNALVALHNMANMQEQQTLERKRAAAAKASGHRPRLAGQILSRSGTTMSFASRSFDASSFGLHNASAATPKPYHSRTNSGSSATAQGRGGSMVGSDHNNQLIGVDDLSVTSGASTPTSYGLGRQNIGSSVTDDDSGSSSDDLDANGDDDFVDPSFPPLEQFRDLRTSAAYKRFLQLASPEEQVAHHRSLVARSAQLPSGGKHGKSSLAFHTNAMSSTVKKPCRVSHATSLLLDGDDDAGVDDNDESCSVSVSYEEMEVEFEVDEEEEEGDTNAGPQDLHEGRSGSLSFANIESPHALDATLVPVQKTGKGQRSGIRDATASDSTQPQVAPMFSLPPPQKEDSPNPRVNNDGPTIITAKERRRRASSAATMQPHDMPSPIVPFGALGSVSRNTELSSFDVSTPIHRPEDDSNIDLERPKIKKKKVIKKTILVEKSSHNTSMASRGSVPLHGSSSLRHHASHCGEGDNEDEYEAVDIFDHDHSIYGQKVKKRKKLSAGLQLRNGEPLDPPGSSSINGVPPPSLTDLSNIISRVDRVPVMHAMSRKTTTKLDDVVSSKHREQAGSKASKQENPNAIDMDDLKDELCGMEVGFITQALEEDIDGLNRTIAANKRDNELLRGGTGGNGATDGSGAAEGKKSGVGALGDVDSVQKRVDQGQQRARAAKGDVSFLRKIIDQREQRMVNKAEAARLELLRSRSSTNWRKGTNRGPKNRFDNADSSDEDDNKKKEQTVETRRPGYYRFAKLSKSDVKVFIPTKSKIAIGDHDFQYSELFRISDAVPRH